MPNMQQMLLQFTTLV